MNDPQSPKLIKLIPITLVLLLAVALTSACGLRAYTTQQTESSGVTTPAGPLAVTVTNFDGPITVTAGPDGRVEAVLTRGSGSDDTAAAQVEAKAIDMAISQSGSDVAVTVTYGGPSPHSAEAALAVTVPAGSSLDLQTGSGEIDAQGPFGDVTAEIDNGRIILGPAPGESFTVAIDGTGELQSDFASLPSQALTGSLAGQVGQNPARQLQVVLGEGEVVLRQISAP